MLNSIPYLSIGLDVGANFTWMSIILPNDILTGKPFKILHSAPHSRVLAVTKIKKYQRHILLNVIASLNPPKSTTSHSYAPFVIRGLTAPPKIPSSLMNSTNTRMRKLHNNKFDSKKATKIELDASIKTSFILDDDVINLHNFVRDYYYIKGLQSAVVLKLKVTSPPTHI